MKKLIPKRRFEKFKNSYPWEQCKLGEVVNYIVDNRGKNPSYYCDKGIPVIDNYMIKNNCYPNLNEASRFIDDEIYATFIRKYNEFDDTLITLVGNGIGNVTMFPKTKSVIVQNTLGLRFNENKKFMFYLMVFKNKEILLLNRGMAQPNIRQDELLDLDIKLPVLDEQNKISNFFFKLDNLITLHQRKLDKLKETKSAYLSEMFPKEGELYPKRRFVGFTDPWEQRKLKDMTDYKNGKGHEDRQSDSGKYELVNLNSISIDGGLKPSGKFVDHTTDTLLENDLVMVLSDVGHGDLLGRVALIPRDGRFVLNQRVALLRPNGTVEPQFLFSYINAHQRYFKSQGAGMSQLNISKGSVENFVLYVPKKEEQVKIGTLFKNLDNLIILHQRKLDKLQALKQAYLSEMFV